MKPKGKEDDKLTKLELEFDINCKIVKATNLLSQDQTKRKSIRKQRKHNHQQAVAKLKDIEKNLQATRKLVEEEEKARRSNLKNLDSCNDKLSSNDSNLNNFHNNQLNKDLALLGTLQTSLPPTPVKLRRNKVFNSEDQAVNPHIENLIKQRLNNQSPEYDTISTAASSLDYANNLFLHKKLIHNGQIGFNNYEELFENSPETETKKQFGVQIRRSAIAPNLSQDNSLLNKKQQNSSPNLFSPASMDALIDKCGLDKFRKPDTLKGLENLENNFRITGSTNQLSSASLLSPNQLQANQFNFGSSSSFNQKMNNNSINKSQTLCNVNMAQRPLPSPPVEHKKSAGNQKQQSLANSNGNKPAPLNLGNHNDMLIKSNPIKSPSIVSMFQQSPLDFEKAASLYLNKQQQANVSPKDSEFLNQHHQILNNNNNHMRDTIVRATPAALTINTNELNFNQLQQHHSPVPLLPPRTPITSKPNILNSLNPNSLNSISSLTLNSINPNSNMYSHQTNMSRNLISSNPNLNHISHPISNGNKYLNEKKKIKGWTETCIDTFVMPNNFKRNNDGYSVNKANDLNNAFNKYHQREKENQFNANLNNVNINNKLASRQPQQLQPQTQQANYPQNNFNQFLKQDSKSSLTSNSSSNSNSTLLSNSSTQIFQPFVEEIKPYELSDFYKYSQKFKNAQKRPELNKELNRQEVDTNQQTEFDSSLTPIKSDGEQSLQTSLQANSQTSSQEDSFISKNQVVDGFQDDLIKWMNDKYDLNKSATLV